VALFIYDTVASWRQVFFYATVAENGCEKMTISTNRESDRYIVRLPDGMRDRIKKAAETNGRSMNAEIVARLTATLEGNLSDLSAEGFGALMKILHAAVGTNMNLMFGIRDTLPGLEKYMLEHGVERDEAIRRILTDWLEGAGYAVPKLDKRGEPES